MIEWVKWPIICDFLCDDFMFMCVWSSNAVVSWKLVQLFTHSGVCGEYFM